MLGLGGSQGMNSCRGTDQAQPGSPGRSLEEVAARTIHHGDTPCSNCLLAARLKTEILAEKRHHVILKAVSHGAGVRARIDFKAVRDSILVENIMQLAGIDAQAVLISHIHGDRAILLEISDVLIDEDQWRISRDGCLFTTGR